jgi:Cyclin, N-terminal domain
MVLWYNEVAPYYRLPPRTTALAVSYFDCFCKIDCTASNDPGGDVVRLAGIASLILASKMDFTAPIPLVSTSHPVSSCFAMLLLRTDHFKTSPTS